MFICRLLILGFILKTALPLRIDEDCEAKSEWKNALNWPEIRIGAWISSSNTSKLEIRTKLANKDGDLYHDKIILYKDHYDYIKTVHLSPTKTRGNVTLDMNEVWMEFIFTVRENFKLWYVGSNTTSSLLEIPNETEVEALIVKGSNITLNCPSKLRMWSVSREPAFIPLEKSEIYHLSFYSKNEVRPSITLESVEIPLRWDGQSLTTFSSMESLPAHQLHNITFECKPVELKFLCKMNGNGNKYLTEVALSNLPKYIQVKEEGDTSYYAILQRSDPYLALHNNNSTPITQSTEAGNGTVVTFVILLVVAIIVIAALGYYTVTLRRKKAKNGNDMNIEMGVKEQLLKGQNETGNSAQVIQGTTLLEAVKENKVQKVEDMTNKMIDTGTIYIEKACVEAHLLCRKEIINFFDSLKHFEREALIQLAQKEYSRRVDEVFAAAQIGYSRRVTALLLEYEIPHTIKDSKGRSILHVITSSTESERPLWDLEHVHEFLQKKSCYTNAVDFDGQTCLHYLANHASNSTSKTIWGGKSSTIKNVWLELAKILFKFGCDPRKKDYGGQLPQETARGKRNLDLSDMLKKQCYVLENENKKTKSSTGDQLSHEVKENLEHSEILANGYINEESKKKARTESGTKGKQQKGSLKGKPPLSAKDKQPNETVKSNTGFGTLINETAKGKTAIVMELMKHHQQLLPLEATSNPLTESITRGHFETSMLLLSGGASICGHSLSSFTPLEAAHGVKSLPAVFPVVLRLECVNRLKHESKKIDQDAKYEKLQKHIKSLISKVQNGEISSICIEEESKSDYDNSKHARELLCMAAHRGLPLTCQMFGQLNVNLQPYPSEDKPILNAHSNGQDEIIYLLTRDLEMSVFSHIDMDKLSEVFLQELWDYELKQLHRVCSRRRNDSEYNKWINKINEARSGIKIDTVDKEMLAYIGQNGLIYIFHVIKENVVNFDINDILDEITGCTILHIAAMYGRLSMVEYLLYDKTTDVLAQSKGGFTAAHLAAVRGYKDCMTYLLFYMETDHGKTEVKCDGDTTPIELLCGYEKQAKVFKDFFISDEIGMEVRNTPNAKDKLRFFLEQKFSSHQVSNNETLRQFTKKLVSEPNSGRNTAEDIGFIKNNIREEISSLLEEVSKSDSRQKGIIIAFRTTAEYLQIPIDTVEVIWEVTSNQVDKSDDHTNFKDSFYESVKKTLKCYRFKSSTVWLSYPSIKKNGVGVTLFLAFHETTSKRTGLIKVFLTPVLKTGILEDNKNKFRHPVIKEYANMSSLAYLANTTENNWVFIAAKMEDEIIKRLTEEQRLVLHGCILLYKLLYSCWWFPKRHNRTWKISAIRMTTLPPRVLTSLFLEEIDSTTENDWTPKNFLERMISIFRRAVKVDKTGKITSKSNILMYLDKRQSKYDAGNLVCCIVEILETLRIGK